MAAFIRAASVNEIPSGSMKVCLVSGRQIAIANVDGEFFAFADTCTHAQCSLGGEGFLEGTTITCGCHGAQFDITNGSVLSLPATVPLGSYQVKLEGEDVFVYV